MAAVLDRPFTPMDFSPSGGGLDFLGMRWVNLQILETRLLSGVNNQTRDFGSYCLAVWIPWKFRALYHRREDFKYSNFVRFQESIEVATAYVIRDGSPATDKYGRPNNRIGVQQKLKLPAKLSFAEAERSNSTSLYAAPLYGPSLSYLGLISGDAAAQDGTSTGIPLMADDPNTEVLAHTVEDAIQDDLIRTGKIATARVMKDTLDETGFAGLHPAYYRKASNKAKTAFLAKLLPKDQANVRTLTARLIIATLKRRPHLDVDNLRAVWHTGLFAPEEPLRLREPELVTQAELWSLFQTRQYQRYIIELMMLCFETAIGDRCTTIDRITSHAMAGVREHHVQLTTFRHWLTQEAKPISASKDYEGVSERWAQVVSGDHSHYIWISDEDDADNCGRALRMLARWWLGTHVWMARREYDKILNLGGEDRLSMAWFFRWVERRLDVSLQSFVKDMFEQLVFAQHVRVALSRFDGVAQRLRFALADEGITPTHAMADKLANGIPGWSADRLDAFVDLLTDLSVLKVDEDGGLTLDALATSVE